MTPLTDFYFYSYCARWQCFTINGDAKYSDARECSGRERVRNDGSVSFFVIDFFLPSISRGADSTLRCPGAVFWTVQLIPQLFKTWRTKSTKGLSPWLV